MTVRELIEKLKHMPQDAIVVSCYDVHEGDIEEISEPRLLEDRDLFSITYKPADKGKQMVEL